MDLVGQCANNNEDCKFVLQHKKRVKQTNKRPAGTRQCSVNINAGVQGSGSGWDLINVQGRKGNEKIEQ